TRTIDPTTSAALQAALSAAGITASNLVQGAWALLLGQLSGRDDIVFGATHSGRPAELAGIDELVGMFTNNIPVRVRLGEDRQLADWLRAIRADQMEAALYAEASADLVQEWIGLAPGQMLFESLVVVENFPTNAPGADRDVALTDYRSGLLSTYPLTLSVIPGDEWRVALTFDGTRLTSAIADQLLAVYARLLGQLAADATQTVGALRKWLADTAGDLRIDAAAARRDDPPPDSAVMPTSPTQLRLAALYEEVLGISGVGINQDFFALGGSSMQAVRLFALIEQRLRRKLPLTVLLERPTIARLAELFESGDAAPFRSLVPVRAAGEGTPLICVHAGGEPILFYRHLARVLGAGPVYGLQPPGLDDNEAPLRSIGALAARYVDELRAVQPEGPYVLLGYCIGATVCLEMARRLERDGQRVARMFVLDSGFWWGERPAPEAAVEHREPVPVHIVRKVAEKLRREGPRTLAALVLRNLKLHYDRRRARAERYLKLRFGSPELRREIRRDQVDKACRHAFERYVPTACHAPTTLLRTTEYLADAKKQRHLAWREVTPDLDERVVDGEHDTMLEEPTVIEVATIVREYLADLPGADLPGTGGA
ncbi:MAG: hypothetical protein KJO38_02995, partial [Gammaproteobacteria bacterium]|nr:hypothetical protein [Gammaproteobacteria bacterium]